MPTQRSTVAASGSDASRTKAARVDWPKLLEHEPFPAMSPEARYRLLEAACEIAGEQLRFRFPGVTVPRDDQPPLPESSRALIRRLARESRERRAAEETACFGRCNLRTP